jgi:lipopolysaccharide heptosyltransferase II
MSFSSPNNILVRVPNWIGDAVMCLPALMDIRDCFAKAGITILARPTIAELLRKQCGINDVLVYEHRTDHRGIFGLLRLSQVLRKRAFDTAVLFQNAFEAAMLASLSNIPIRIGYATDGRGWLLSQSVRLPSQPSLHQTRYYQQLVQTITKAPSNELAPKLVVTASDQMACEAKFPEVFLSSKALLIGINPGSIYGSAKRWLPERFAELGDQLVAQIRKEYPDYSSVRCLIIGGKGEEALGMEIANRMCSQPIVLSGMTSIRELMGILRRCAVLVSNDTGPMHMAQALGVPVVAIFGSTDPETTRPSGGEQSVIRTDVRCAPCLLRACPIDHRCMTGISTDQVMTAVMKHIHGFSVLSQSSEKVG